MQHSITCFVIIGFGKKTSYANGKIRVLDLDETYSLLIKPVFDNLNIPCYRAIDKNLSGSIDKLMLLEIKHADIALVDISTLNANVMWELGVRHALKPRHTIMICEKEQMNSIPFDVNNFVVHKYTHSEEGIPFGEVNRFRTHLTAVVKGILSQTPQINDSPVFTFLEDDLNKESEIESLSNQRIPHSNQESFSDLLARAEKAKNQKDFEYALKLFGVAKTHASSNMSLKDNLSFIISRQALCTYQSKYPNELEALRNSKIILEELNPQQSNDIEVLGLAGAINKRLYELTDDINHLDNAILYYEKGFLLKQDYYNGINAAFMLYRYAELLKIQHKDWEDTKLKADYIRNSVLKIALHIENEATFSKRQDAIWVLFTIAEAYNYKGNTDKRIEYEQKAIQMAEANNDDFAISSYKEQKMKIEGMTSIFKTDENS